MVAAAFAGVEAKAATQARHRRTMVKGETSHRARMLGRSITVGTGHRAAPEDVVMTG